MKLFGTDGIRSLAGNSPLDTKSLIKLSHGISDYIKKNDLKKQVVISKDTRISSDMIISALSAGFCENGINVDLIGIYPTPALSSYVHITNRYSFGIMVSASHNPYYDNGIKIFSSNGTKINSDIELYIEKIFSIQKQDERSNKFGKIQDISNIANEVYFLYSRKFFNDTSLYSKIKIVVDVANGASVLIAKTIFSQLNINAHFIFDTPDGYNINSNCGSLDTDRLSKVVIDKNADLGIAFDGDGDRIVLVDNMGNKHDGDSCLAIIATYLKESNSLSNDTVVATEMSNFGLELFLQLENIKLKRTSVGDKFVFKSLIQDSLDLGGEPSGHIILKKFNYVGDALLVALEIITIAIKKQKTIHELLYLYKKYPQEIINIPISEIKTPNIMSDKNFVEYLDRFNNSILKKGRIVIRPSGTEPLLRIMAESEDVSLAKLWISELYDKIKS